MHSSTQVWTAAAQLERCASYSWSIDPRMSISLLNNFSSSTLLFRLSLLSAYACPGSVLSATTQTVAKVPSPTLLSLRFVNEVPMISRWEVAGQAATKGDHVPSRCIRANIAADSASYRCTKDCNAILRRHISATSVSGKRIVAGDAGHVLQLRRLFRP